MAGTMISVLVHIYALNPYWPHEPSKPSEVETEYFYGGVQILEAKRNLHNAIKEIFSL
jgi:hypothetical protein